MKVRFDMEAEDMEFEIPVQFFRIWGSWVVSFPILFSNFWSF